MTGLNDPRQTHARFVDVIFARPSMAHRSPDLAQTPTPGGALDPARFSRADLAAPPQPPANAESGPEYDWLVEERKRLEAYTQHQLHLIKQQREEFLRSSAQVEEAFARKGQEVNRQLKQLQAQTELQSRREHALAEREAFLATHQQTLIAAEEKQSALQQSSRELQEWIIVQETALDQLRVETMPLAELNARQIHLENRFRALEEAEAALEQRLQEVDDLETQLRSELEEQERELTHKHREVERLREQVRLRSTE